MKTLIVAYFFAYAGAVLALFRPFVGLCFFYSFILIGPQYLFGSIVGKSYQWSFYLALGTIIGTFFLWIRSSLQNGTNRLVQEKTARAETSMIWIFFAFTVVFLCSAWGGTSEKGFILLKIFIMFSVGCYLLDSPRRLDIFLWVLLLSQAFITVRLNSWYFLDGFNPIIMNDGYGSLNNNGYALFLLPGIGLAVMGVIYNRRPLHKSIAFFAAISSIHIILLSESRGSYLGLAVIMLVVAWYIPKDMKTILAFSFVGLILLALSGEAVQKEFSTIFVAKEERDGSAQSRFVVWGSAFDVMLEHPLLGVGPDNFFHVTEEGKKKVAHNLYLQTGAESGIPALLLLVFLYFQSIRKSHQALIAHKRNTVELDPVLQWGAGGVVAGLLGYLTHSMFSSGLVIESPYVSILIALAVFRAYSVQKEELRSIRKQEKALIHAV